MPHRDDLAAAHARIAALERELAAAKKEDRPPLRCVRCRGAFEPRDLDGKSGQLTCRGCKSTLQAGRPATRRRIPRGLEVEDTPGELRIEWEWRVSPVEIITAVVAGGLLIPILAGSNDIPRLAIGAIVMGAAVLVLLYRIVAQAANRTIILVRDRRLEIDNRPIALRRSHSFHASDIDQIYCVAAWNRYSTWYELWAQLAGGEKRRLVHEIADVKRAFFLEREIERHLGIVDRPVKGEVPRRDG
jgi:hypothetical protein